MPSPTLDCPNCGLSLAVSLVAKPPPLALRPPLPPLPLPAATQPARTPRTRPLPPISTVVRLRNWLSAAASTDLSASVNLLPRGCYKLEDLTQGFALQFDEDPLLLRVSFRQALHRLRIPSAGRANHGKVHWLDPAFFPLLQDLYADLPCNPYITPPTAFDPYNPHVQFDPTTVPYPLEQHNRTRYDAIQIQARAASPSQISRVCNPGVMAATAPHLPRHLHP